VDGLDLAAGRHCSPVGRVGTALKACSIVPVSVYASPGDF
jgi:hypothetical protein